jgi:hypothetical protein
LSATSLQALAAQLCAMIDVAPPQLDADDDGIVAFSASLRGVDATFTHDTSSRPDEARIHVFFGHVPEHKELEALRELLNANYLMQQAGAPSFSRNPDTGELVLQYVYPLEEASGENLWAGLQTIIDRVLRWRETFALSEADKAPFDELQLHVMDQLA